MVALLIFIVVIILVVYIFSFYSVLRHYLRTKILVFLCETQQQTANKLEILKLLHGVWICSSN